jgi:integrase
MRRGEILAHRWKNVDLESGAVRVVESLEQTKVGIKFKALKAEKERAVPLPRFAFGELRGWKRQQAEALLRLGVRQIGDTLVCARGMGSQSSRIASHMNSLVGRDGVPRVRFHDLRHSHAPSCWRKAFIPRSCRSG